MNKFNTQALIRDFPYLYRLAQSGSREPMMYGFQAGDGWFQLVYELSTKIEERAAAAGLDPKSKQWPAFAQVKEKFGELRAYMLKHSQVVYSDLVAEAVAKSKVTCELCGKPGKMHAENWMFVRCDKCHSNIQSIRARLDAEHDAEEKRGGYRAVIDEAFAQADALAPELSDEALQGVCDASKAAGGEAGKRVSILYDLGDEKIMCHSDTTTDQHDGDHTGQPLPVPHEMNDGKIKCYCGTTTDQHDEGVHERYKQVMDLRLKKEADELAARLLVDPVARAAMAEYDKKKDIFADHLSDRDHKKEDALDTFFLKRRMFKTPPPAKSIKEVLELLELLKRPTYMSGLTNVDFNFSNAQGRAVDVSRGLLEEALRIGGLGHVVDAVDEILRSYNE